MVLVIVSGLALLVRGETKFDMLGFGLVMTASCLSGLRFTLTQVLLHGHQSSGEQQEARQGRNGGGGGRCEAGACGSELSMADGECCRLTRSGWRTGRGREGYWDQPALVADELRQRWQ